ncbi:DUF2490 domain-containing protein [Ferruginibacter albus]|uniref:DUF2490 domain-containing protein n=1 Tax=Ferruginibacter albus TaxID=2875540 RepID=UPI001CC42737|nr:DUF2490 domain-containing protein [Ferruginibacter albus]UAY52986.1 DUF2490 domain-containing protein [Ferruginibacter albus]
MTVFLCAMQAQKTIAHTNMVWLGYNNTLQLNDRFSIVSEAQLRTRDNWMDHWSQLLIRSGVSYGINKKWSTAAGFAWFSNVQYVGKEALFKNEWRPWEDLQLKTKIANGVLTQRLRLEQRFLQLVSNNQLSSQYEFVFRTRYRIDALFPVNKQWQAGIGNEIIVNPQFIKTYRFFDQERIFAILNKKFSRTISLQLMLMELIQNKSSIVDEDQNIFRLTLFHQIGFKHPAVPATKNEE